MALSLSVRDYRVDNSRGFFALFIDNIFSKNVILSFFGEAGFNGSSSVWTMQLVKTGKIEHFYGLTYVGSVFGLIPSSVDFLGIAAAFSRYTQLESLLTEAYSFDFGVGFSLVAESYLNFGYFGFIAIFFEGLLLCKLLNIDDYSDTGWKNYVPIVLLSVLLTMPRRDTVFFSNQFTSCVIVPYVVMLIVTWVKENIKVE